MRNIIFYLASFLFAQSLVAQSFHRGALILDLNTGIEAYSTRQNYQIRSNSVFHDTAITAFAANKHVTFGAEIGLSRRFGIGIRGKSTTFFEDIDAVTRKKADIRSTDLVVSLNLHPVVRKKFDLILGADFGLSDLGLQLSDKEGTIFTSRGYYIAPYLNPRVYLGRFGFNLKTSVPFLSYSDFTSSGESNVGNYMLSAWKGSGFGMSLGIQLRLF